MTTRKCLFCFSVFPIERKKGDKNRKFCSTICYESKEKIRARNTLLSKYGLDIESYNKMFLEQDGKCLICSHPESERLPNGQLKPLAVDHCHITGTIRGLLCLRCNIGIGNFNDNWVLLQNAMEYLVAGDLKAGINQRMGNRNDYA